MKSVLECYIAIGILQVLIWMFPYEQHFKSQRLFYLRLRSQLICNKKIMTSTLIKWNQVDSQGDLFKPGSIVVGFDLGNEDSKTVIMTNKNGVWQHTALK